MRLFYEWGTRQLRKHGEELCGDNVAVARHSDYVTLALSDGLGSGVKANILSILTTRIVMHLMENRLALREVVDTLSKTLPVCEVRKLAYSTFAIGQFFRDGNARVVEFDTPSFILVRRRKYWEMPSQERRIEDKTIRESEFKLEEGDWLVFVSDGVVNAGIGGRYPLGWGRDHLVRFLEEHCHPDLSAQELVDKLAQVVRRERGGDKGPAETGSDGTDRAAEGPWSGRGGGGEVYPASGATGGVRGDDGEDRGGAHGPQGVERRFEHDAGGRSAGGGAGGH